MGKRKIIWIFLTLLSIVAITVYGGIISYSFFYACILIPVIAGIYLLYVYICFKIYQKVDSRNIVCGESVPYFFILHNDNFVVYTGIEVKLYSDYSHVENMKDGKQYRLYPGDQVKFETKLTCKYRGEYEVGVKEIIVYDFLGLFHIRYKIPSTIKALVIPRIIKLNELKSIPYFAEILESEFVRIATEADVIVRDYQTGDSLRRIHWKQTAREHSLKVRNEIGIKKQKATLLFTTERSSEDREAYLPSENKILETVIALLYYFQQQNTDICLLWEEAGMVKREIMNMTHFEGAFRELAKVAFRNECNFNSFFYQARQTRALFDSSFLFLVTAGIDYHLFSMLTELAGEERMIVLYVVTKEDLSEYILQNSPRLQIIVINPEQELSEVL